MTATDPVVVDLDGRLHRLAASDPAIWIHRPADDEVRAAADQLPPGPLHGWTVAVKDNVDVAGSPTTGGLPSLRRIAGRSATVVDRVLGAGSLHVGKANLDQLATGLVGLRSPYGTPVNPLDARLVPGGSSSGSAVAVAAGLADLSIATDTAGSGRVPAACCGIVGLKPAPGTVPVDGVLPASPSYDCVSLFTRTVAEALVAGEVLGGGFTTGVATDPLVVGVPDGPSRVGLPPAAVRSLDADAAAAVTAGHRVLALDLSPFLAAGALLYEGPLLAERTATIGPLLDRAARDPDAGVVRVVREVVARGRRWSGVDVYTALAALGELRSTVAETWEEVDVLVVPSVPEVPEVAAVHADPIGANLRLGRFTTFANLLGLAAITVPRGWRDDGTPASLTVLAPAGRESAIARAALDLEPPS